MITDAYTVQYLLEGTLANPPRVVWRESPAEGAGLTARAGGVEVKLSETHSRSATRLSMRFRRGDDTFSLHEPVDTGWFRNGYASADEEALAQLFKRLWRAAIAQSEARSERGAQHPEEIRNRLYQQLLFEQ